jgi:hypothetical protein
MMSRSTFAHAVALLLCQTAMGDGLLVDAARLIKHGYFDQRRRR